MKVPYYTVRIFNLEFLNLCLRVIQMVDFLEKFRILYIFILILTIPDVRSRIL